jgi:hypothetical protein
MNDLDDLEATLQDSSSGFRDSIMRDIGQFTVAILRAFQSKDGEHLELAGNGTLVFVILTIF